MPMTHTDSSQSLRLLRQPLSAFRLSVLGLLTALMISTPSLALETDAQQAISVLADSAEFNPDQGLAIYTGRVEIEQGSLKVNAHQVTVYRQANGEIDKIIAQGQNERVHMQQQPQPEDPIVHAYAMRIEYLAGDQQVLLNRQAQLENGQDRFTGERIRYHLQSKRIQAWGQNPDKAKDNPADEGRVKIILFPADNSTGGKEAKP